jgi:hypothetical protein
MSVEQIVTTGPNPSRCPENIVAGLLNYRDFRLPTGGFLRAVLSNDLRTAVALGDPQSLAHLRDIVAWLYDAMPAAAWGSASAMADWLGKGRA